MSNVQFPSYLTKLEHWLLNIDQLVKSRNPVIPAEAGIHNVLQSLDSHLRGNDEQGENRTFYESNIQSSIVNIQ